LEKSSSTDEALRGRPPGGERTPLRPFARTELPALIYHHVGPLRPNTFRVNTVDPGRLRRHLGWLRRHDYGSLSVDQVIGWALRGEPLPSGRNVLLTFDDGYADLAAHAFPLLEAAGYSAVVFLVTRRLGGLASWDEPLGKGGHRVIDEETVKDWSERGIEFGAHTRTHTELGSLAPDELEAEIQGSRADLEALIQRPAPAFAYPYSALDPRSVAIAASAYDIAFTGVDGPNLRGLDPHLVGRTAVKRNDISTDIASRVRFGRSPRQDLRAGVGRSALRVLGPLGVRRR